MVSIFSAGTVYQDSFFKHFGVQVHANGSATWAFGGNFITSCNLDMTYFPFDTQTCSLSIENWAYDTNHVSSANITRGVNIY